MGSIKALGRQGHSTISWEHGDTEQVEAAKRMFEDLKKLGYAAFAVAPGGGPLRSEVIREFDETEEEICMVPPVAGGA